MSYSLPEETSSRHVVVVGSGTLGRRVALMWASKGSSITIVDSNAEAATAALGWIKKELPGRAKAVHGTQGKVSSDTDTGNAVKGAWMAVECIPEIKTAKSELLAQLDRLCDEDAIIATISSSYKSGDLIDKVSDKGRARVLNTHYFQPPELPPVEIMSCGYTNPAIIEFLVPKLREIGLDPVVAKKESTGFICGRIWAAMKREIMMVLADEVGTPEDIDKLFRYAFQSKGAPCALMDNVGLQTVCNIEEHYIEERGNIPQYPVDYIRQKYVDKRHLGIMTGKGLYDHQDKKNLGDVLVEPKALLRSQLIGAWELVEYSARKESDSQDKIYPMGRHAQGIIMYTPDGYMSAQLQIPGQPHFKADGLNGGTEAELQEAGKNYLAYTGPYYVDESGKEPILQHHMTNCSFPNWLNDTQRRIVNITKEGDDTYLTLGPEGAAIVMGERRVLQLKWRRLGDNQASAPPS